MGKDKKLPCNNCRYKYYSMFNYPCNRCFEEDYNKWEQLKYEHGFIVATQSKEYYELLKTKSN
jgi:hypothetical protein